MYNYEKNKKKLFLLIVLFLVITAIVFLFWFSKKQVKDIQRDVSLDPNRQRLAPEPGDHLFGLGGGYAYFGTNAYYEGKLLEGVDGSELEYLESDYAKDKTKVFYKGKLLENADAETFKKSGSPLILAIFVDKSGGYYMGERITFSEIENMKEFLLKDIGGQDLGNNYRKYKNRIFYWDDGGGQVVPAMVLVDANPDTFVSINNKYCQWNKSKSKFDPCKRFGKDNSKVFTQRFEIKGANPDTFEILKGNFSRDKDFVFYDTGRLPELDPKTFEVLGLGGYGKDKNKVVYTEFTVDEADPKTFEVLHEKYCLAYSNVLAKDKNNYYFKENKITESQYKEHLGKEKDETKSIRRTCN